MVGMAIGALIGMISGQALGLEAMTRTLNYTVNPLMANRALDPPVLASLEMRNVLDEGVYEKEMAKYGFNAARAKEYVLGMRTWMTAGNLLTLYWRNNWTPERLNDELRKAGFTGGQEHDLIQATKRLLDAGDVIRLKWRGVLIDEKDFHARMKTIGITEDEADKFEASLVMRPSPGDVIRFAVREAFYDKGMPGPGMKPTFEGYVEPTPGSYVEKYGLDNEYPPELTELGLQVGMRPSDGLLYWRSHWELPSMTQAYEMHARFQDTETLDALGMSHELLTTTKDMDNLMAAQDIMPWWRPRMMNIAHALPTRVDIRRMRRDGILKTDEEATALYRARRYSPKDAANLTKLAHTMYKDDERDLCRSLVLKALKQTNIKRGDAVIYLQALNYTPEDAEMIVSVYETDWLDKELEDRIDEHIKRYAAGQIDQGELLMELDKLGLTADDRKHRMEEAYRTRRKGEVLPTKTDLLNWLKAGVIGTTEYAFYLGQLNVSPRDIQKYVAFAEKTIPKREEEEEEE